MFNALHVKSRKCHTKPDIGYTLHEIMFTIAI